MKPTPKFISLAVLAAGTALAAAGSATAQQTPRPGALIKQRQSSFQVNEWNSHRIKSSLDGAYNKDQVLRSANVIAAIANSGLGSLFAAGTESGKGWHDTTAKPELFTNGPRFAELGGAFAKQSTEFARVVSSGADEATVKDQFAKLENTCKSCHDDFRNTN